MVAAPPGLPWLGHLPAMRRDPLGFLTKLSGYGDAVQYRIGGLDAYAFFHPDLIRDVLVTKSDHFHKGPVLKRARVLLGEGLLTSEAPQHLRRRRLAQPAFARERLMGYGEVMVAEAARARGRWQAGQELDIDREMMRVTLAIVARTLFSADVEGEAAAVGEAMDAVLNLFGFLLLPYGQHLGKLPLPSVRRFRQAQQRLEAIIHEFIRERRAAGNDQGDLLSMLLLARDEDGGPGLTDRELRDELLTLFMAGHETTANALTWTWTLLSQHPDVAERLQAEWATVLGGNLPTPADLPRLTCTEQVVAESMRLYPPAWGMGRLCVRDVEIGAERVPAGAMVLLSPWVTHRDARFYTEPLRFDPDRWELGEREKRPKFAYFPFGAGPRMCIGERFAWMEAMLVLATIGSRWRLRRESPEPVIPRPLITLRTKDRVRMRVEAAGG